MWKMKPTEPRQVMRFEYELPEGQQFSDLSFGALAVSPDGSQFVYSTTKGLYLRSINELTAKLIAGTEESVQQPFFSPDGKWIGYYSAEDGQLKKISITGGAPVPLCAVTQLLGACWTADNTIVYGHPSGGIMRISAYLFRRTICHARGEERLEDHLELLRCYYNFVRPHRALKFGPEIRTPAMQAGLLSKRLSLRKIFVAEPERILFVIVFIDVTVESHGVRKQGMAA